jgi:hypothetical protein
MVLITWATNQARAAVINILLANNSVKKVMI